MISRHVFLPSLLQLHSFIPLFNFINPYFELTMPGTPAKNDAARNFKRKTAAVYGKVPNKRTKSTKDGSQPSTPLPPLISSEVAMPDSLIGRQQSSPAPAQLSQNRTPDVQFSTPIFDTAIHSRQPDAFTRFKGRPECSSPTKSTRGYVLLLKSSSPTGSPTTAGRPLGKATPVDTRNVVPCFRDKPMPVQQFLPSLRPILEEAKRLMRDWTMFVNPFPEPNVLVLESLAVAQLSRQTVGLKVLTSPSEDGREYLSSCSHFSGYSILSPT